MNTNNATECADDGSIGQDYPHFHIVGIGASAGGLEPLEAFFKHMPVDSGMAFVVVQHLSPDFKSQMEQLLARKTSMPIHRVEHGVRIEPNKIYLIPPRKIMIVANGQLLLTDKDPADHLAHPIDEFFRSLANDAGRFSIAIVLSGTGADGSRGVVRVAEAGGLVLAQDEATATFDGMPLSAVATGAVTMSLPPEAMPEALLRYVRESLTPGALKEQEVVPEELDLRRIFQLLKNRYKLDFSLYKASTVARRISRRLLLTQNITLERYVAILEDDPDELDNLYQDLLIGVTRFFRDAEMFHVLETQVVPKLVGTCTPGEPIRVWVAACATGEEAYSIAMLFHEQLTAAGKPFDLKIFATDVHPNSIKFAGNGIYSEDSLKNVSDARRRRYFSRRKEGWQVDQELRRVISFATHNLITDAPFTRMDFISCRNLLIYLQPHVQKKLISLFHFSLKPQGVLSLGISETVGELAQEFDEISARHRIYTKKRDVRLPIETRLDLGGAPVIPAYRPSRGAGPELPATREHSLLPIYDRLLDQFMPPAFLLDEKLRIVHIFGGGERFLRLRSGRTSVDFLELIEPEARTSFGGALNHVVQKDVPVNYTGVKMKDAEGVLRAHQVTVQPLYDQKTRANYFFVKLTEQRSSAEPLEGEAIDVDAATREHIDSLENELRFSQENLQATIEELETANEEMQASNEELVASNEELQSTNEELQSVNEELYTVNHEYQKKIAELTEANDDMDNLLATTRVGVIFLDEEFCIRRFTPEIARLFNLLPQDIGRSISGFSHSLDCSDLPGRIREVFESGTEFETETRDQQGAPYILRILPYRSAKVDETQGVVLTLIDIENLKRTQSQLTRFKTISDLTSDGIALLEASGGFNYVNAAWCQMLGYEADQLAGMNVIEVILDLDKAGYRRLFELAGGERVKPYITQFLRRDGSTFPVEINLTSVRFDDDETLLYVNARDVTERMEIEHELALSNRALESSDSGIFITGSSGGLEIIYANKGFCDITGYSREEVLGRNCLFLQGAGTDARELDRLRRAIDAQEVVRATLLTYRKSGEAFWNDMQLSPVVSDDGKVRNFIGVLNDVTDHRQAEEQARTDARKIAMLLNSTEQGIYYVNRDGICVFSNQSAARLLGYESPEELTGRDIHETLHHSRFGGEPYPREECPIVRSLASGRSCNSDEEVFWKKDGSKLAVEYWSHPIEGEDGRIEGSVVTFIDITSRRLNQEKLVAMQENAEQANRTKTVFLANISHELRTPLSAILGCTELLQSELEDDGARKKLDVLQRNSMHLLDLLNDLLDLAKIETGFIAVDMEECSLAEILADVQAIAASRAESRDIELRFEILNEIPEVIVTDPVRCRQIVNNLLSNALKFTEKGSVTLSAQTRGEGDKRLLEIAVTDTGRGIAPEERENLFKPFLRGSDNKTRKTPGSGLGLSISQQLAGQLGGRIGFDSTPGVGSQFRLTLPLRTPKDQETRMIAPGLLQQRINEQAERHLPKLDCKVLVVDDHEDIRSYLSDIFTRCKVTTMALEDGKQAVDYLEKHRGTEDMPDIVLMDIHMPVMDGLQAVEHIRNRRLDVPVIAITAGAMKAEREQCLLAGFDDFLSKPLNIQLMLAKIESLLGGDVRESPRSGSAGARAGRRGHRLLVVDDGVDVTIAIKELLASRGFEVQTAYDGKSAIEKARSFRPDAVLLDIGLPDMDGCEVLKAMARELDGAGTAYIALTGYSNPKEKERALAQGFDEYLIKPVTLTSLINAIDGVLERKAEEPESDEA